MTWGVRVHTLCANPAASANVYTQPAMVRITQRTLKSPTSTSTCVLKELNTVTLIVIASVAVKLFLLPLKKNDFRYCNVTQLSQGSDELNAIRQRNLSVY